MKKILTIGGLSLLLIPALIVTVIISPIIALLGNGEEDSYSIIDVAIYEQPEKGKIPNNLKEADDLNRWLIKCQNEIQEMRADSGFKWSQGDTTEIIYQKADAEDRASAFILGWYLAKDKSPVPAGISNTWSQLAECFIPTSLTNIDDDTKYFISESDECWKKIEKLYGISISSSNKGNISTIYENMHNSRYYVLDLSSSSAGIVGDLFEPDKYPESTVLSSSNANIMWDRIYSEAGAGNNFRTYSRSNPQCTDVAHWRFWSTYGADWKWGGNGVECVSRIVQTFGDESNLTPNGYYFVNSTSPSGGSVFSRVKTSPWGHTGFIEKVEGDYLWYTDGNINIGSYSKCLRVNYKITINSFLSDYCSGGGCTFAVPQKVGEE